MARLSQTSLAVQRAPEIAVSCVLVKVGFFHSSDRLSTVVQVALQCCSVQRCKACGSMELVAVEMTDLT